MTIKRPTDFPIKSFIDGSEEIYTQTSGVSEKFTLEQAKEYIRPYKVYTALLTQSGGNNNRYIAQGDFIELGITYYININSENADLTVFGAPNNDVGTSFVCVQSGTLPSIGSISLLWNEGAPIATVLENTIGNIWFSYREVGVYSINIPNFDISKTYYSCGGKGDSIQVSVDTLIQMFSNSDNQYLQINTFFDGVSDGILKKTPIEIRVYN